MQYTEFQIKSIWFETQYIIDQISIKYLNSIYQNSKTPKGNRKF